MARNAKNDDSPIRYVPKDSMLETVFPVPHRLHDRLLYDRRAGQYYDRYTDMMLSLDDAIAMGLPG